MYDFSDSHLYFYFFDSSFLFDAVSSVFLGFTDELGFAGLVLVLEELDLFL